MKNFFYSALKGLCFLGFMVQLHANPESPDVVSGNVSFNNPDSDTLVVTSTSSRSIVDWETFSIGSNELTTFNLPCSTSAILNRVTSENVSNILGELSSNGQVYLINQNGIVFGSESIVNTSAFVASTLDCDNTEFLNNTPMTYLGEEDDEIFINNYGAITATDGDIILLSYQIQTAGDLTAENGAVGLGAGVEITVTPGSEQRIGIVAHSPLLEANTGIDITSTIACATAEVKAQGNLYTLAIRHEGWIDSQLSSGSHVRITGDGGAVTINGLITALDTSSEAGGTIDIMGQDILLDSTANVVVSAAHGAGVINIGQALGGEDPNFVTAENVTMSSGATIDASALYYGEGGQVVLWASDTNDTQGVILSTGGAYSGDGGIVEVAGLQHNSANDGNIDVSSPTGDDGQKIYIPSNPYP